MSRKAFLFACIATLSTAVVHSQELTGPNLTLQWKQTARGWELARAELKTSTGPIPLGHPSGEYTILYSPEKPDTHAVPVGWAQHDAEFPEPVYTHTHKEWDEATTPVSLNLAGQAYQLFPSALVQAPPSASHPPASELDFSGHTGVGDFRAHWAIDAASGDVKLHLVFTAARDGWFSLATPTLATLAPADLAWAVVPGYYQGRAINPDFVDAFAYGHGLPSRPVIVRDRTASTLASIATNKNSATFAVVAEPGMATDPWARDKDTRQTWTLGLSHMNRRGELSPTLYRPILGEAGSHLKAGESTALDFRYTATSVGWFEALRHTVYDVYRLKDGLQLKAPAKSLSERLWGLADYVRDDRTSLWRTETYQGRELGAQAYNGGVVGSQKDAMKNSDYGAMWMLATLSQDPQLVQHRLPYALNFKLAQQEAAPGFFQGAALGQYYLSTAKRFAEEWGDYVEPVALTYYTLSDLGNILLFDPANREARERLKLGAERLLAWQRPDGSWEVAYRRDDHAPAFPDLHDFRPTFYGLFVAWRILHDDRYLAAARKGADWLIAHAVEPGYFLGVCGDARFAPDFATGQIAQGLLDLYDATGDPRYRDAAVTTARYYVTSIYTHPIPDHREKISEGRTVEDWQINQTGLSFEHGGTIGSATTYGPILLCSHAGLFLRIYALTHDPLFADLARAGVTAREAFVDTRTGVASYYWKGMNHGPGPYPHHAWWQLGWIEDYLVSEAAARSGNRIAFPHGFMTPKVGPHVCYGFAPGTILGEPATLAWTRLETGHPAVEYLFARSPQQHRVFIVLMNSVGQPATTNLAADAKALTAGAATAWRSATITADASPAQPLTLSPDASALHVPVAPYGISVLALDY